MAKKSEYDHSQPIILDGHSIGLGEQKTIKVVAGRTPSDNQITIVAHIYRSKNPGPTILALGGIHGDEINGIEVVNQLVISKDLNSLKQGTVIAIPLLNAFGFNNLQRDMPDGKDVNRSFPGSASGSLASRIANTLTKKILPLIDLAVDFHTGGSSRYNYPQVRYTKQDEKAHELCAVFKAPFTIQQAAIKGSFRKVARDMGVPCIVYEAGESTRLCGFSIHRGKEGFKRVLDHLGMIDYTDSEEGVSTTVINATKWIRTSQPGIFIWSKSSGQFVTKGEPVGIIKSPFGTKLITIFSKYDGHIIGHNNASVVNQGDPLFHIGIAEKVYGGF